MPDTLHNLEDGDLLTVALKPQNGRLMALEDVERLLKNCRARGFEAEFVESGAAARERLMELIPADADVSNGGSVTLKQIGFLAQLEAGAKGWRSRRAQINAEPDEVRRQRMRRDATTVEYVVGSVNALAMSGEAVLADFGGTRVGAYAYGAGRVIWVVGVNKVVDDLSAAMARVREIVHPLEDQRTQAEWGVRSKIGKMLVIESEPQPDRIHLILVNEDLGF